MRNERWQQKREQVLAAVTAIRKRLPRVGTRKLQFLLAEQGLQIGRDCLFRLLEAEGLLVQQRSYRPRTTNSKHWMKRYPNRIKAVTPTRPNEVWVADITYIRLEPEYRYLCLITDAYSHCIVGSSLAATLETSGPLEALREALAQRTPEPNGSMLPLIHHSDRGVQYCSKVYTDLLQHHGITISMTENGDPYENAIAERVNGILKTEFSLTDRFKSAAAARRAVRQAVQNYNALRPHMSCQYLTPQKAHQGSGLLQSKWTKRTKQPVNVF